MEVLVMLAAALAVAVACLAMCEWRAEDKAQLGYRRIKR